MIDGLLLITRYNTIGMKKVFFILFCTFTIPNVQSQNIVQQIENKYNTLDSISYFDEIILSYKKNRKISMTKFIKEYVDITSKYSIDSIERNKREDSIFFNRYPKETKARELSWTKEIENKSVHYVLNLNIDRCRYSNNEFYIVPDTSYLSFNLFYYDKRPYIISPIFFVYRGEYSCYDVMYRSFSKKLSRNFPKVLKKILKKNPKYLLFCEEFEGMNTILYLFDGNIYVYRIIQKEEYELNEYLREFKPEPRKDVELE